MDCQTLKERRIKLRLTQRQLASLLGVTEDNVCKWETGKREFPPTRESDFQIIEAKLNKRQKKFAFSAVFTKPVKLIPQSFYDAKLKIKAISGNESNEINRNETEYGILSRELSESEDRYRLLFDSNPLPAWVMDAENYRFLAVNAAAIKLYGFSRREFSEMNGEDVRPPADASEFFSVIKKLEDSDGVMLLPAEHRKKNGEKIDVEISYHRIVFESRQSFFVIVSDVTRRRLDEERIRQQASLLDKTKDAILVCDLNYRILYWNKGAELLYGWRTEDVLGKEFCEVLCSGDNAQLLAAQKTLFKRDEFKVEANQTTRSSETVVVKSRWNLVRNEQNQPDYFLIINTDITEQKKSEEQLLRVQRMESIGTLAGGIAHDLNNVLSPILMATDMLALNAADDESARWLSIVRENTTRGADLIRQVLTFARGVEGERVVVQLKHLIKDSVKVLQETFPKSITIKFDVEPELKFISADPTQFHQVLMNLCINARDAMPAGGTLTITAKNILLDENYARTNLEAATGNYIVVTVTDTGTGMPPEIKRRIFDPFFTTKDVGKGTGLGLSTALSIVKSHGGFVKVYSEQKKGTRFSIYLPASESAETGDEKQIAGPYPRGRGELILAVDDEENIRQIIRATLEKFGYRVLTATDGANALAAYSEHQDEIALVLTDMMMPVMDGAAMIRALRQINPELRIIAASGLTIDEKSADLQPLSINATLAKPYTAEKLLTTLADVLR